MHRVVEDDPVVHLVGDRDHIVLLAERGDPRQLGPREDFAGRVVRRVEDDDLRLLRERGGELRPGRTTSPAARA